MAVSDSDDDSSGDCNENGIDLLPIKSVSRIVNKALPANTIITEEATQTVQECASEFIAFLTCEASEKCKRERRMMMTGDDIISAMTWLGFDDYVGPLQVYLQRCVSYQRKGKRALEEGEECSTSTARDKKGATAGNVVNMENSRGGYDNEGMYGGGMGMTARDMVDDIDACARGGNVVNMWNSEGGYGNGGVRIGMANDDGATTTTATCNGGNIVNMGNGEGEYGNGGMDGGMGMLARDEEGGSVACNVLNMGNSEGSYGDGAMIGGMEMVARDKEGGSVACTGGNVVNESGYGNGAMDGGMGMVARDKDGGSAASVGGNVVNMGNSEGGYGKEGTYQDLHLHQKYDQREVYGPDGNIVKYGE